MKYLKKILLFIPLIWLITGCQQSETEQQPNKQTEASQQQVAVDKDDESASSSMGTPPENEEPDQPLNIDEFNDAIYEVVQDSIQDAVENAVEDEVAKEEQQQ